MDQYVGEIALFSFNFAPKGWALCNGQLLPIAQNQALFALLGTTYGGDGRTTFALPNLQGRMPIGFGQGTGLSSYSLGQNGGVESVTLDPNTMAAHTHSASCSNATGNNVSPGAAQWAVSTANDSAYSTAAATSSMSSACIQNFGNGQAHPNLMPGLALNFAIALVGAFPPRS